ncbi:hypothetical protein BAE44_0015564, partial [Dichanthelium oligosanthes]
LLQRVRLPTRDLLCRRHIAPDAQCPFCSQTETQEHLLLHCYHAQQVWSAAGMPAIAQFDQLSVMTAILWNIWKHRNAKVFGNHLLPIAQVVHLVADDFTLWAHREKNIAHRTALRTCSDQLGNVIG